MKWNIIIIDTRAHPKHMAVSICIVWNGFLYAHIQFVGCRYWFLLFSSSSAAAAAAAVDVDAIRSHCLFWTNKRTKENEPKPINWSLVSKKVYRARAHRQREWTHAHAHDIRLRDACIIIRVRSECVMTAYAMWACVRASVQSSKLCMTVCSGINHLHHCAHNSQNHRISHTITGTMVMRACARAYI